MLAQRESTCPLCPDDILAGDRIEESATIEAWAHEGCALREDARVAKAIVCSECFIIKPCECDS